MDSILKYNRIQGKLIDAVQQDKISAVTIGENLIIVGTNEGFVHIASFTGQIIKSYKAHEKAVNAMSLDNLGTTLLSCSDTGTVVLQSLGPEDEKESLIHMTEPLKAICVEDDNTIKRERSFIVGTISGQLIHHRHGWFTQKNVTLFSGADSPVQKISWRGNIVAWADATQVRLMDITTQSAICYLSCPQGVGPQNPYPCTLYWESETDLLIGWADSFRHLQLHTSTSTSVSGEMTSGAIAVDVLADTVSDWLADCIICDIVSLDVDHILLLGYVPAEPSTTSTTTTTTTTNHQQGESPVPTSHNLDNNSNYINSIGDVDEGKVAVISSDLPELQIVVRATGELITADALPLNDIIGNGNGTSPGDLPSYATSAGPWAFRLLSDHQCPSRRGDHTRWSLNRFLNHTIRGGLRGLSPLIFVISLEDMIIARIRDTDDRIYSSLNQLNYKNAMEIAISDPLSLRQHRLEDLISKYLNSLLEEDQAEEAAAECPRLLGQNALEWEKWIYAFALKRRLSCLASYIPTNEPRLPPALYEMVLDHFLANNTKSFLEMIQKWGRIQPALLDLHPVLVRLEARSNIHARTLPLVGSGSSGGGGGTTTTSPNTFYSSGSLVSGSIGPTLHILTAEFENGHGNGNAERRDFQHVFELIEKEELYSVVKDRILNLVRLSRMLSGPLLLRRLDFFPVSHVVSQLYDDRRQLLWYLHLLFTEIPDKYNSPEYSEFHVIQVTLYAEFATPHLPTTTSSTSRTGTGAIAVGTSSEQHPELHPIEDTTTTDIIGASEGNHSTNINNNNTTDSVNIPLILPRTKPPQDSDLLKFLKSSSFIPLELAWRECAKKRPPLHHELVYILTRMGNTKEAL
eukprot:gene4788-9542_t